MSSATQNFDAVVVGAGFSGIYMLKSLRDKLGLNVRVYEDGETVGGTWYWNRYPGARCDSDSYIYCYTWDKQLLQEWEWSERYPEQDEILRYLEHVAKRHDLKRDIQFGTRVTGAEFDEATNLWTVHTDKGEEVTARYLIPAGHPVAHQHAGPQGTGKFGLCYHTSRFPHYRAPISPANAGGRHAHRGAGDRSRSRPQLATPAHANYCVRATARSILKSSKPARPIRRTSSASANRSSVRANHPRAAQEATRRRARASSTSAGTREVAFWLANYQDMFFVKLTTSARIHPAKTVEGLAVAKSSIPCAAPMAPRQPLTRITTKPSTRIMVLVDKTDGRDYREGNSRRGWNRAHIIVFATGFDAMTGPKA